MAWTCDTASNSDPASPSDQPGLCSTVQAPPARSERSTAPSTSTTGSRPASTTAASTRSTRATPSSSASTLGRAPPDAAKRAPAPAASTTAATVTAPTVASARLRVAAHVDLGRRRGAGVVADAPVGVEVELVEGEDGRPVDDVEERHDWVGRRCGGTAVDVGGERLRKRDSRLSTTSWCWLARKHRAPSVTRPASSGSWSRSSPPGAELRARSRMPAIARPSCLHGVHCPQDSTARKCETPCATATMSTALASYANRSRIAFAHGVRERDPRSAGLRRGRDRGALPPDAPSAGFDNIAAALSVSPTLLEGYALAAMQIGRRAVGDRSMGHGEIRYAAAGGSAQQRHIEGLPLGTRGGIAVEHNFPLDAEYEFAVQAALPAAGWDNPTGRLVCCDGPDRRRRVQRRADRARRRGGVPAARAGGPAAHHRGARRRAALRRRQRALSRRGRARGRRHGARDRRAVQRDRRRRHAEPARDLRLPARAAAAEEAPCAQQILARLATRAYRRPVRAGADELEAVDASSIGSGARKAAISRSASNTRCRACSSIRSSSIGSRASPPTSRSATSIAIGDLELASRLSFFLWSSIPDDELLAVAAAGELHDPQVLAAASRAHARRRALAARSSRTSRANGSSCASSTSSRRKIRTSTRTCATRFRRETELLFADVLRERRSVLDAARRGLHVSERAPRRALRHRRRARQLHAPRRAAAGQSAPRAARPRQHLTATSAPNRTSPVVRGQWIVQNILGAAVPNPPPGAEADLVEGSEPKPRSSCGDTRARAPGDAPRESDLRRVPRDHGPARPRRSRTSISWAVGASRRTATRSTPQREMTDGTTLARAQRPAPRAAVALRRVRHGARPSG